MLPKTKLSNTQENPIFVYYDRDSKLQIMELNKEIQKEYIQNITTKNNTR